jgi:hypothetical protein
VLCTGLWIRFADLDDSLSVIAPFKACSYAASWLQFICYIYSWLKSSQIYAFYLRVISNWFMAKEFWVFFSL